MATTNQITDEPLFSTQVQPGVSYAYDIKEPNVIFVGIQTPEWPDPETLASDEGLVKANRNDEGQTGVTTMAKPREPWNIRPARKQPP